MEATQNKTAVVVGAGSAAAQITKEVKIGPVVISKEPYTGNYQKEGTLSIELRQEVETTTKYPAQQVKDGGLFSKDEFGIEDKPFTSKSIRVTWLDVPEKATMDEIKARLAKMPKCGIQTVLSNHPILTPNQKNAIERGIVEGGVDKFANAQVVRYPESSPNAGEIILDRNKKPMYRVNRFLTEMTTENETLDLRNADPEDYYVSEDIALELSMGVSASQIV